MKFRNKVIIGVAVYLILFSQEIVFLMAFTGMSEPSILIGSVFGAGLGEFGLVALVTTKKIKKKGENKDEGTDC